MRIQDGHTEIYSVDNIISSRHTGSQAYVPFSSFRHRGGMLRHDAPERYYHTRVKRGPSGLHDTWLILGGDAFDADRMLEDETLSLSLTGTNGHLPVRLYRARCSIGQSTPHRTSCGCATCAPRRSPAIPGA